MPFIPDNIFGWAYAAVLLCASAWAWRKDVDGRLIAVMWLHFAALRTIDATAHLHAAAWIMHDVVMVMALLVVVRTGAAKVIAAVFFVMLQFDLAALLRHGPILPEDVFLFNATVGEIAGYISMLVMAGAGDVDGGRLERTRSRRLGLGGLGGCWSGSGTLSIGRQAAPASGGSHGALAHSQKAVP